MMRRRYDALIRTTVDLPEDLHRIVTPLAIHTRRSLSVTAAELIRRGLASAPSGQEARVATHAKTGLPVIRLSRTVTPDDVRALEDEA